MPYEKGFHFVWYLERLVGREAFDKFITFYFTKWSRKSLDKDDFKNTYLEFFSRPEYASLKDKIASIDWEEKFHSTGLPPKPEFDTSLVDVCYELAEKWKGKDFTPEASDVSSWTGNQKLVFLNAVQGFKEPLTPAQSQALGKTYGLVDSQNVELKAAYYLISLKARDESTFQGVAELLGGVGRMKFGKSIKSTLIEVKTNCCPSSSSVQEPQQGGPEVSAVDLREEPQLLPPDLPTDGREGSGPS